MLRILFVCTGNICRSSTAEGLFQHLIKEQGKADLFYVESAGLYDYHAGEAPDSRTLRVAAEKGIDLSLQRARKIMADDFYNFDFIFAMDQGHYQHLVKICPRDANCVLKMFIQNQDVPDPWYGSINDFKLVYDIVLKGVKNLLTQFN